MNKAVAYFRCSGSTQVEGDTFPRQRDAVNAFGISHGFEIECEFIEAAIPGKTEADKRPAFQEMIACLLGNGCKTIVVEALNRLARDYAIQQQLITYIASKGLTLISADTGEDITAALMGDPMKRALVQMQGVISELDKNMTVAKLAKAKDRIRKEGRREGQKNYSPDPRLNRFVGGRRSYSDTPSAVELVNRIHFLRRNGYKVSKSQKF